VQSGLVVFPAGNEKPCHGLASPNRWRPFAPLDGGCFAVNGLRCVLCCLPHIVSVPPVSAIAGLSQLVHNRLGHPPAWSERAAVRATESAAPWPCPGTCHMSQGCLLSPVLDGLLSLLISRQPGHRRARRAARPTLPEAAAPVRGWPSRRSYAGGCHRHTLSRTSAGIAHRPPAVGARWTSR